MSQSVRVMVDESQRTTEKPTDGLVWILAGYGKEFTYLTFPTSAMERLGDGGLSIYLSGSLPTETGS